MKKQILFLLVTCLFISCKMNVRNSVCISGSISFDEEIVLQNKKSARSAFPTVPDTVFYEITADKGGTGEKVTGTVNEDLSFSIVIESGFTWIIKVTGYKVKNETGFSTPILEGQITVTDETNNLDKLEITVTPINSTDTGTVNLPIYVESEGLQCNAIAKSSSGNSYNITIGDLRKNEANYYTMSNDPITPGIYNVIFNFIKDSEIVFFIEETVNVKPNLQTSTWVNSASAGQSLDYFREMEIDGKTQTVLYISDELIEKYRKTVFFVDETYSGAEPNGTYKAPFNSLSSAITTITSKNDETSTYTIFLLSEITKTSEDDKLLKLTSTDKDINLNIYGNTGAENTIISGTNNTNNLFEFDVTSNSKITLKNLSFENGKSAIKINGGKELVLNNCTVKDNDANSDNVIQCTPAASGSLDVKLYGKTEITGNKGQNALLLNPNVTLHLYGSQINISENTDSSGKKANLNINGGAVIAESPLWLSDEEHSIVSIYIGNVSNLSSTSITASGSNFFPTDKEQLKQIFFTDEDYDVYPALTEDGKTVSFKYNIYTITYTLNSSTGLDPKWIEGKTYKETFAAAETVTLPDSSYLQCDNYTFAGWYDNEGFTGNAITGWSAGEKKADVTLYAKWTPIRKASGKIKPSIHENIKFSLSTEIVSLDGETIDIKVSKDGTKITDYSDFIVSVYLQGEKIIDSSSEENIKKDNSYVKYEAANKKLTFKKSTLPLDFIVTVSAKYNSKSYSANLAVSSKMCYVYQNSGDLDNIQADGKEIYVKVSGANVPTSTELNALTGKIILDLSQCKKNDYSPDFSDYGTLKKIILPDGVTSIGDFAFQYCTSLTSIEIPDSVTSIGELAFSGCTSLTSIEIPDSVTSIGEHAFHSCFGLTSIEIPDSVISIGSGAFYNCTGLTSIEIGDSVTSIGNEAFNNCISLKSIEIGESVTSIGEDAFVSCTSLTSIEIPDSVTSIENGAFYYCESLKSIEIGESVTSIGRSAFEGCLGLTSIEIPDSVTSIGNNAFYNCRSLTSIEIPDSVTSIGNDAFRECYSLTSIKIPDSVTSIGKRAFSGCLGLTSIEIPDSVTSIENEAFYYCTSLTSIEIGDSVTSIGESAFQNCTRLTSIEIPDSVTSIGSGAFSSCSGLTSIEIPDSVKSIGGSTFNNCTSLTSIKIPDSVTSIEGYAFRYCSNLTSIKIPDSVTSIGELAFYSCTKLTSVIVNNDQTWNVNNSDVVLLAADPGANAMNLKNLSSYKWTR